ncbi:MAG: primosomal protein N', partial [Streptosporangiaceae bacterium]
MTQADRKQTGMRRVPVLLPYPFPGPFDYRVPPDLDPVPGDVVMVPLNGRETVGVVWESQTGTAAPDHKLKPVSALLDTPPMRPALRRLVAWVASYTLTPPGEVMAMALRAGSEGLIPPRSGWSRANPAAPSGAASRITPARERVLAALAEHEPQATADLLRGAGVGRSVLHGMADAGLLVEVALEAAPLFTPPNPDFPGPVLSPDQAAAGAAVRQAVSARSFSVTLLDGVTGSGKTEVYFEAVAECLRIDRQALVLLPEIALSSQWLERFAARFGVAPAVWHSDLSSRIRRLTWREVAAGRAPVVVGARSALFLPFPDLGLIVVDEEHETAFKQEEGVVYHARDMAVVRARFEQAPALLVSATPSLETVTNVQAGRYRRLTLPNRHGGATLPAVATIDLRTDAPERGRFLAPPLVAAINDTLARGEQAMLFLNRRGYAPLTLCRACGHRFECPNCAAWLVEHRFRAALVCHHCGHVESRPQLCPQCHEADSLTACGPGVERLAEEAAVLFPDIRTLVLSSDTPGGIETLRSQLDAAARGAYNLIIGTQLVAKGHNFPLLTFVCVVDADVSLANADPRAAERTFQLLRQATGRAGRGDKLGRALLQTWQPEHPVIAALISDDAE